MKSIGIIFIVIAFVAGSGLVYIFNKLKRNKKTDEANRLVGESNANDEQRAKIKSKIEERIKENDKLREELKDKLK